MVKLTAELIEQAAQYTNAVRDRELDLRGARAPRGERGCAGKGAGEGGGLRLGGVCWGLGVVSDGAWGKTVLDPGGEAVMGLTGSMMDLAVGPDAFRGRRC